MVLALLEAIVRAPDGLRVAVVAAEDEVTVPPEVATLLEAFVAFPGVKVFPQLPIPETQIGNPQPARSNRLKQKKIRRINALSPAVANCKGLAKEIKGFFLSSRREET
jgi:hypothetical protein